ncbi:sulfotransferase domain-containing protein [Streptomyces sp. MP131-18]|uniref:sulfotransferase domain-containing protein n=1 Tax=Streptomyces sp. MP131-18 TaxID=1857892 RepID=UPI0009C8B412|nr:sulfotransferase domain-containing protein [Streptomyces sp. MP131-18]ONK11115.1 Glycolipid sulfotransferase [Streptomyces sp. MP131-18]
MDSTHWDGFQPREGDIVISTAPKVGTTWTQRIVSVLVFQHTRLGAPLMDVSPWLDGTFTARDDMLRTLDGQRHRRFIKSHLPLDGLPFHSGTSYLIVGRDPRDTVVSAHNHARGMNATADDRVTSPTGEDVHTPEQPVIADDLADYWPAYFTRSAFPWEPNGWPFNSPTRHLESWWAMRDRPNVLFLHYQDLLNDLDGEMRRISAFLGIPVDESVWPGLVAACRFSAMKAEPERIFTKGSVADIVSNFEFFHRGRNGQWRGAGPEAAALALYRAAVAPLPEDLRAWLTRSA